MNQKNWLSKNLTSLLRTSLCLVVSIFGVSFASANTLGVDTSFLPPSFAKATPPERALLLPDGKYFLYFDPDTLTDQRTGALTRFLPDGTFDTTFSFNRDYKTVTAVAPAGNGQYYVSATKYVYGAVDAEQILRVNSDGSVDPTFAPATVGSPNAFPEVQQILVQPDGRVLVAGTFQTFAGNAARDGIVRLLTDGTVDSSFAPVTITGFVYSVALQDDGKVLIGGTLSNVNGVSTVGIVRLNSNGSLDSSFQGTGFARNTTSSRIRKIVVQPDGLILMSGALRVNPSSPTKRMAVMRVTATGAFDSTFDSSTVTTTLNTGRDIVRQPDGTVMAVINNSVYHLNANGTPDSSFHVPIAWDARFEVAGTPITLQRYANGQLLVGGIFTDVNPALPTGQAHYGVARLNNDGTLDPGLVTSRHTGTEITPSSFVRLNDGSVLIVFADQVDPAIPYNVARLLPDGSRDPNFTLSSSDPGRFLHNFIARGIEPLLDGKFLVYGSESSSQAPVFGKVDANGVEDTTFGNSNGGLPLLKATVAPDGRILETAEKDYQTTVFFSLGRMTADGQTDLNVQFVRDKQVVFGPSANIQAVYAGSHVLAVQPDGRILYLYFALDSKYHLVRVNENGSLDSSFQETTFTPTDVIEEFPVLYNPYNGITFQPPDGAWSASPSLLDAHVQPDGRIIITGHFTSFANTPARGIVRLETSGAVDSTFNTGGGMQWTSLTETATFFPTITNIEPTAGGKLLIVGNFEAFNGTAAPGIARLNADGSVDTSFVAPVHLDKRTGTATTFRTQPDGSFLLRGPYLVGNETNRRSLIRLIDAQPGAVNISTRLGVGSGDDALIEGFIVQGPAGSSKKIMVRAIGPSLSQFGVSDALQNPTLEIHDASGNTVATNNDWKITQTGGLITGNQFAEINGSGIAPTNDLESAVIVSLTPGSYTAVVRGAGNSVGTGVVDAFDLDAGSTARVANIATRGVVQPGDKLMIAGFIVQNGAVKVVVRGIGPSLLQFGISNALPDTTLQLRDQQGAIVLENDDWKTSQQKELEDLNLQPTNDLEAALVTTIQPGQYTAQLRGKNNDSGIGVVQVYFLQ